VTSVRLTKKPSIILAAFPENDPEGLKAKSFYRQIIQNNDIDEWEIDNETYSNFVEKR
jgi:hypothetical protein